MFFDPNKFAFKLFNFSIKSFRFGALFGYDNVHLLDELAEFVWGAQAVGGGLRQVRLGGCGLLHERSLADYMGVDKVF